METIKEVIINGITFIPKTEEPPLTQPKPEFKVGQWVIGITKPYNPSYPKKIKSIDVDCIVYYEDGGSDRYYSEHSHKPFCRLATEDEIKAQLVKEAKERGYKHGVMIVSVVSGDCATLNGERVDYDNERDILTMNSWSIYSNGKWAEIIKEPKPFPNQKKELRKLYKEYIGEYTTGHKGTCNFIDWLTEQGY